MNFKSVLFATLIISGLFLVSCSKTEMIPDPMVEKAGHFEKGEVRGIWLRPPENVDEIPIIMDRIEKAGFNIIFLETLYHGFTIFPGSNFPNRPEYKDKDVLQLFINQAHKRGIAIHCWTEVFYWQVDTTKYPNIPHSPVLDEHPDWRLLTREGKTSDISENAHIFADPANPSVQIFLKNYYKDLLNRYDIDGLNLDYIRYPAGSHDTGYTDFARSAFKSQAGVDPMDITPDGNPEMWMKWVHWREDIVTDFVRQISDLVREEKPEILLSSAIFAQYYDNRGKGQKYQDWAAWTKKGFIDVIIPMAYSPTMDGIKREIKMVQDRKDGPALVMPALAVSITGQDNYGNASHPPIDDQIEVIRSSGLKGHSTFCYGWIMKNPRGFEAFDRVYNPDRVKY